MICEFCEPLVYKTMSKEKDGTLNIIIYFVSFRHNLIAHLIVHIMRLLIKTIHSTPKQQSQHFLITIKNCSEGFS